jgi:ankyrin repeat protein
MLSLLVEGGGTVNVRSKMGTTPLFAAATRSDSQGLEVVQFLLSHGAKVNIRTVRGETELHWAAHSGSQEIVRKLIEVGSDPNAEDNLGLSVRDTAEHARRPEIVKLLATAAK